MSLAVRFAPEAERDLNEIYDYIAQAATPGIAGRYVDAPHQLLREPRHVPGGRCATTSDPDFEQPAFAAMSSSRSPRSMMPS